MWNLYSQVFFCHMSAIPQPPFGGTFVFATDRLIPLEQHDTTTLVSSGKIITRVVKLNSRDDIR